MTYQINFDRNGGDNSSWVIQHDTGSIIECVKWIKEEPDLDIEQVESIINLTSEIRYSGRLFR